MLSSHALELINVCTGKSRATPPSFSLLSPSELSVCITSIRQANDPFNVLPILEDELSTKKTPRQVH